jgi:hypothetical protein
VAQPTDLASGAFDHLFPPNQMIKANHTPLSKQFTRCPHHPAVVRRCAQRAADIRAGDIGPTGDVPPTSIKPTLNLVQPRGHTIPGTTPREANLAVVGPTGGRPDE